MKIISRLLMVAATSCASWRIPESGPWLLPRGKQLHFIHVARANSQGARKRDAGAVADLNLSFTSAVELTETEAHVTALSPLGLTMFSVDDARARSRFQLRNIPPSMRSREPQLRMIYERLRPLFWARASRPTRDIRVMESRADQSAKKIAWQLGPYTVTIEVEPQ